LQRKILEESLNFYDQLLDSDPDPLMQFSRTVTARFLSDAYLKTSDPSLHDKARDLLKQAISQQESLCHDDPDNLQKLRQLGFSYRDYANYFARRGASESLIDRREKCADIFRRLASREPQNKTFQIDFAKSLASLADQWVSVDPAKAVSLSNSSHRGMHGRRRDEHE
jgi:tetratricopeptide (TPR) repeat protein